ncbi:endolytic transglycosylase MltG [Lapidilactobacillus luobeiensis]|uniref:endolytic transglycosylase MltG n=1 Tax=Lapidilactobacillus luobeiensis TaxID=2950371 RepID=UPI0021C398AB|nr:endolytic transglycosylase MltG [Lapidilactobacillus luobeiensis]
MQEKKDRHNAEKRAASRIAYWIIGIISVLVIVIAFMGYRYVHTSLEPLNSADKTKVEVKIPIGSSNKEIATKLQNKKIIKSAAVFSYYVKAHNYTDFQAGEYYLSPAMTLDQIIAQLQKGHSERKVIAKVLIKEGVTIEEIGTAFGKNTKWTKKQFLALMKNETYLQGLAKKYPELLTSAMSAQGVRYRLEGYLFPLTYSVYEGDTLKGTVTSMVKATNDRLAPYYATIKENNMTVQQLLTLASLVEREGVKETDRKKIAGVFFNRLAINMPLQSDISVMYALNTHKESLTNKDTAVASPYNLYIHTGYGPGPFNSPSLQSIQSVLEPSDRDQNYLYFVANLKTGKVYYSHTYDEHLSTNASLDQ